MYLYIFICLNICICIYIYIYTYAYVYIYIYIHIYIYIYVYVYIYIHMGVYIYIYRQPFVYSLSLFLSFSLSLFLSFFLSLSLSTHIYTVWTGYRSIPNTCILDVWQCMSHVYIRVNAQSYTYEWAMSLIRMRHVTVWMNHGTRMNESCDIYEWATWHIWMSRATESCESSDNGCRHTHESHIWVSRLTHMNKSRETYERVVGHIRMWHPPKNGEIILWPSTNGSTPDILAWEGSESTITDITMCTFISLQ